MKVYIVKPWKETNVLGMKVFASISDAADYLSEKHGTNIFERSDLRFDDVNRIYSVTVNLETWNIFEKELEGSFEVDYKSNYDKD